MNRGMLLTVVLGNDSQSCCGPAEASSKFLIALGFRTKSETCLKPPNTPVHHQIRNCCLLSGGYFGHLLLRRLGSLPTVYEHHV